MDKPFLLSDLVDLQEIDNLIYSINQQKKDSNTVVNLKNLETEYKSLLVDKNLKKDILTDFFETKKDLNKKLQEIEIKNDNITSNITKRNILPSELENYQKQLTINEKNYEELLSKIDQLQYENKEKLTDYELVSEKLNILKDDLVANSKLLQEEWNKLDKKISDLENQKNIFLNNLNADLKILYKNLKSNGVDVVAAYNLGDQCGCCGVDLTSSELEQVQESKFKQCPYCSGVIVNV
ncbi:MAG: hypothetical protein O3A48_00025 [Actinomycetota bacterium]|nr:hypothetical protein [Actinomycetota bacterium]MDA3012916.1 hypothetical protein [Actinomycetota bacterium]